MCFSSSQKFLLKCEMIFYWKKWFEIYQMDIYQTKFINIDKEIVIALKQFFIV